MNRFNGNKINPLILIFGVIILASLGFTIINQNKQNKEIKVYTNPDNIQQIDQHSNTDAKIETYLVPYDDYKFSIEIPNEWSKVVKDGYDNYIHSPSATSVGIEILPYEPTINLVNESDLSTELTNSGFGFVSFERKTTSSYEVIYQNTQNSSYDYIDEVIWSRENIVKLHFIVNDNNFTKMSPFLDAIYNSFKWNADAKVIPDYIVENYISYGDFEFGLPTDWTFSYEGNSIYSTNPDNSAQMVLTISEYSDSLEDVTSYDITSMLQPSRNNGFMLQTIESQMTSLKATEQYYNNNGDITVGKTYLYANGVFLYNFQFDYVYGSLSDTYTDELMEFYKEYYLAHNKEILEKTEEQTTEITTESTTEMSTMELTTEALILSTDTNAKEDKKDNK